MSSVSPSESERPTQLRILTETWRLMEEQHGQGVRIHDIARAAGVSRQAVYLHFTSRAHLLKATLDHVEEALHFKERIAPVFGRTGAAGIEALVDFWAAFMRDSHGISRAFLVARTVDPDVAAAWDGKMSDLYNGCLAITRCSARDNLLAPGWTPEAAADYLWTIISIENWEHLTQDRGWTQTEYLTRITAALQQVLLVPSPELES